VGDDALAAVYDHGKVSAQPAQELEHRLKFGHHREAGKDPRPAPFVEVIELVAFRADAQRVERGVFPGVFPGGSRARLAYER